MNRTLQLLLLSAILIGVTYSGYLYFKHEAEAAPDAASALPPGAFAVIQINSLASLDKTLAKETTFWDSLSTVPVFQECRMLIRSLKTLREKARHEGYLKNEYPLFCAFYAQGQNPVKALYTYYLGSSFSTDEVLRGLLAISGKDAYTHTVKNPGEDQLVELIPRGKQEKIFFGVKNGLLMAGAHAHLVEEALQALRNKNGISSGSLFKQLQGTTLAGADVHFFLSVEPWREWIGNFLDSTANRNIDFITSQKGWIEADLNLRTETFRLVGIGLPEAGRTSRLGQAGMNSSGFPRFAEVLPGETVSYMILQENSKTAGGEDNPAAMGAIIGNASLIHQKEIAWLWFWQTGDAERKLMEFAANGRPIRHKGVVNIFPVQAQKCPRPRAEIPVPVQEWKYALALNDYILFATDSTVLMHAFDQFEADNTLHRSITYNNFMEDVSTNQAFTFFIHLPDLLTWLKPHLLVNGDAYVKDWQQVLQGFDALAIQLDGTEDKMFLNAFGKYHPYRQEERSKAVFDLNCTKVQLATAAATEPFVVRNHYDGTREVLIQDQENTLYLVNAKGEILWKKQVPERILDQIVQVDRYKNGKLQLMFATENHLYQIDRNGKDVSGFPVKIAQAASAGVAVFDYENKKDYRILVPCRDGTVLNMDIEGKPVQGWNFKTTGPAIEQPLTHFSSGGMDFIVAVQKDGRPCFLNRRGDKRWDIATDIFLSPGNTLFFDETAKTFISTDSTGNLLMIDISGKVAIKSLPPAGRDHQLLVTNITGDKKTEYLITDRKKLLAYGPDESVLFECTFDNTITQSPQVFSFSSTLHKVGVSDTDGKKIFLYNTNGSLVPGFPLPGLGKFKIQDLDRNGTYELTVAGPENQLWIYTLPETVVHLP